MLLSGGASIPFVGLIILNATGSAVDATHRCLSLIKTPVLQAPLDQRILMQDLAVARGAHIRAKAKSKLK